MIIIYMSRMNPWLQNLYVKVVQISFDLFTRTSPWMFILKVCFFSNFKSISFVKEVLKKKILEEKGNIFIAECYKNFTFNFQYLKYTKHKAIYSITSVEAAYMEALL